MFHVKCERSVDLGVDAPLESFPIKRLVITLEEPFIAQFQQLVHRATNCWTDASPEMKDFADHVIHGKALQNYYPPEKKQERWVCLLCGSGTQGVHGALEDGSTCPEANRRRGEKA